MSARKRVTRAVEMLLMAGGTVLLSHKLLQLTSAALWLPPSRRLAIVVLLPAFGLALYTFVRLGVAHLFRRLEAVHGPGWLPAARLGSVGAAVLALLGAVAVFEVYAELRDRCVISFQPPDGWWSEQFGEPGLADEQLDARIPPFLNRRTSEIYVPLAWDEAMRASLLRRGRGDVQAGLRDMLLHEPMLLVDWIGIEGKQLLAKTTAAFFWQHVAIVLLFSLAAGLLFTPLTTLTGALSRLDQAAEVV